MRKSSFCHHAIMLRRYACALAAFAGLLATAAPSSAQDDPQAALSRAAGAGDIVEVNRLLQQGIRPRTSYLRDPVARAGAVGEDPPPSVSPGARHALAAAARGGHVEVVRRLLSAGADANLLGPDGVVPLAHAVMQDNLVLTDMLLRAGADPDVRDVRGYTPLLRAASEGRESIVRRLLEAGADVEARDRDGLAPLAHAAMRGDLALLRELLERGALVDRRDRARRTPLYWAITRGHDEVAFALLEAGADVHRPVVETVGGRRPIQVRMDLVEHARWAGRERVAARIEELRK